jgi:histidine ammonia-lyase
MGTIAARDCIRVIELTEQVASAALLASVQALLFRQAAGEVPPDPPALKTCEEVLKYYKPLEEDRPLENELRETISMIRSGAFTGL